jgi:hypothetical protein
MPTEAKNGEFVGSSARGFGVFSTVLSYVIERKEFVCHTNTGQHLVYGQAPLPNTDNVANRTVRIDAASLFIG